MRFLKVFLVLIIALFTNTLFALNDPEEPFVVSVDSTKGAKINVYCYESTAENTKDKPLMLVHGFNSAGNIWCNEKNNYVDELTGNGYDVIVVDMRGNAVDTDGDHKVDMPVIGNSWGYGVMDLGDDVGAALKQGLNYLNKNLPGRSYEKADIITHSTGALAVTSYSRSLGLIPYCNNIDTIIELAPPNNGSTSLIANIKEVGQVIPSVFTQSIVTYEYCLEVLTNKVWIPGGRMESEILRKELRPDSLFLKSIEDLGPDPSIKTFIGISSEDWVVGDWSPVIEGRDDIGYEYFLGLDHFDFCNSETVIAALLDKLEKHTNSRFFNRYKPYRNKNLLTFLSGPGIDHPDDTFDVVTFANGIDISPVDLFNLYLRIAGRKDKTHLLRYWEAFYCFDRVQKEINDDEAESVIFDKWCDILTEKNKTLHDNYDIASKEYLECPDIAILANGYYKELAKLIIEKVREPVRIVQHTFNPSILNEQKILLIPSGGLSGLSGSVIFKKKLTEFVKNGGILICFSQQYGYDFNALPVEGLKGYGWQEDTSCYSKAAYIENFHQILSSQTEFYPDFKIDGYFTEWPPDAQILLRRAKNLMPVIIMHNSGEGSLIILTLYSDWGYVNEQTSESEVNFIRDLIRWSKIGTQLPEYKMGEDLKQIVNVEKNFAGIEMVLRSPDDKILEKKSVAESAYELGVKLNKPGIYCVDYILYDSDSEIIQPQTEGLYFCFTNPPEASMKNSDFTFDITSDGENYISGSEAVFTFHINNNSAKEETVRCKAEFSHHEIKFTELIEVPANSSVCFDKKITLIKTDRITASFYSSGNNFLGRAERGINVHEPVVDISMQTYKKQYMPGQDVSIGSNIINNSHAAIDLLLILTVLDTNNSQVYYDTKSLTLDAEENALWKNDFKIAEDITKGEYKIKLCAFSNSRLVGASSLTIDIPGPLLYENKELPYNFFELLTIDMEKVVYMPGEPILAKAVIDNKGKGIDLAILDIRVLLDAGLGELWGIISDNEDNPISGARVNDVYTNSEGRYRLKKLKSGRYILNIETSGYDKISKEINILAGDNNLGINLTPSKYGNISGILEEAIGSNLRLEPIEVTASYACNRYAVVSSEGKFEFKYLPIGTYRLHIQPEGISEVLEIKEGDNIIDLSLFSGSPSGKYSPGRVEENGFNEEMREAEPNNSFDTANEISPDKDILGKIYDYGDEDYFKFTVALASILNISLTNVAEGLSPHIKLYDSEKRSFDSTAGLSGEDIEYSVEISENGFYYLHLKDRYNSFSSEEEYILNFTLTSALDQYEPNFGFSNSKDVNLKEEVFSTIFPKGDEDYFSVNIESRGIFYIKTQNVPEGLRVSLKIYDSDGRVVSQKAGSAGEQIELETEIAEIGRYYILIRDWYSAFSSVKPYSFKSYFIDTLDEFEPNDTKEEACFVEFGKGYFATISTKGDSDFYKLSIPDSGKVFVYLNDISPNIRPYIKLYKDPRESWIDSIAGFEGDDLIMQFETNEPSNYFIQIQDRYNSEASLQRYRFCAVYSPKDEYLSVDNSVFKEEIGISNITDRKVIDISIPGIEETGKYYLQAALKSLIPEENSQAVERFYVSDLGVPLEPVISPDITIECLENEATALKAGEKAFFKFKAINKGSGGGLCKIDFRFIDLCGYSVSEFLEPDTEKDIQFEISLPVDLEEGMYEAEYEFEGEKYAVRFKINGVKIDVKHELENGIFKLKIKNTGSIGNMKFAAEVKCGQFEDKKDFILQEESELIFNAPSVEGENKVYYGIYFESGKALYLNSFVLDEADKPAVLIKAIEARCDKNSYQNGELISINWNINCQEEILGLRLVADLIEPDSSVIHIIEEDLDIHEGINVLDKNIAPQLEKKGIYRIIYRFFYHDSVIAQGSVFFDVDGEARLTLKLDKKEYIENEPIVLDACCFSSFSLDGELRLFLDDKIIKTTRVDFDGYKEFGFDIDIKETGRHRLYGILGYDNKEISSDAERLVILPEPKTNNPPILLTIGEKSIKADEVLEFFIEGMDIDGDDVFYSAETLPDGAVFDFDTKRFYWKPSRSQVGEYFVIFGVSDNKDSSFEKVRIVVEDYNAPPVTKPLAEPLEGTAPLEVYFSAESVIKKDTVKYEWDFDGKGIYDYSSFLSGDVIFVYTEEGTFPATLRIIDNEAHEEIYTVDIRVTRNTEAPYIVLDVGPVKGTAPHRVCFRGNAVSSAEICKYEWDFDGDRVCEACSTKTGELVKTYGVPGTYASLFKVTNSKGLSASQEVLIEVLDPGILSAKSAMSDIDSCIPAEMSFDADITSKNQLQKYQWDFEGDGIFDYTSINSSLVKYTYFQPGIYMPTFRVTDENNICAIGKKQIRLEAPNKDVLKLGKLRVSNRKGGAPFTVRFYFDAYFDLEDADYFWDFDGNGICDLVSKIPEAEFTYYDADVYIATMDVSSVDSFTKSYKEIIYVTNGKNKEQSPQILTVSKLKERKYIPKEKSSKIELSDKTSLVLPAGILMEDDFVDMKKIEEEEVLARFILQEKRDVDPVGEYRECRFDKNDGFFDKEMTISIPYADKNQDGFVDEKDVNELTLDVYWFDEDSEDWKLLSDVLVFPQENIVTIKTNHLSLFAIVGKKGQSENDVYSGGGVDAETGGEDSVINSEASCFIATAVYGSPLKEEIITLCALRDKYLLNSDLGREFVNLYYHLSPPIAVFIKDRPFLKLIIRFHLKVLVSLGRLVL